MMRFGTKLLRKICGLMRHSKLISKKCRVKYESMLRKITRLEYQNDMPFGKFTAKSVNSFSTALRDRLKAKGRTHFRRIYVRSLISRIDVTREKIKICGSNAVLAGLASNYNSQSGRLCPLLPRNGARCRI